MHAVRADNPLCLKFDVVVAMDPGNGTESTSSGVVGGQWSGGGSTNQRGLAAEKGNCDKQSGAAG